MSASVEACGVEVRHVGERVGHAVLFRVLAASSCWCGTISPMRPFPEMPLSLAVSNSGEGEMTVVLEPWAEEFPMLAGDAYEFTGCAPTTLTPFAVECSGNRLIVSAIWPQSVVVVRRNGVELATASRAIPQL